MSHFITLRRIDLAKDLLRSTDWQIKRIAHSCGFANPSWFSYVFKDQTGTTPGAYRQAR
jgi:AraC-like DNA-binding protein